MTSCYPHGARNGNWRITSKRATHFLPAEELQPQPPIPCREQIVAQIADLRKISAPEGIQVLKAVELGGTKQWISIRGLNPNNPHARFERYKSKINNFCVRVMGA